MSKILTVKQQAQIQTNLVLRYVFFTVIYDKFLMQYLRQLLNLNPSTCSPQDLAKVCVPFST